MRKAGAMGRALMIAAAAQTWKVDAAACTAANGEVIHTATGKKLGYGKLAAIAAKLTPPAPETLVLKDPKDYKIIGKAIAQIDQPKIVTGQPLFGIDFRLPGMVYAIYEKAPAYGARLESADFAAAKAHPGVRDVFAIEGAYEANGLVSGVAIIADTWWAARTARTKLNAKWQAGPSAGNSSDSFAAQALAYSKQKPQLSIRKDGDPDAAFKGAAKVLEAAYEYPFIVHAPLEPQNCTVQFKDGKFEIWAPTQNPDPGRQIIAKTLNVKPEDVTIHMLRCGGGFGRRLMNDFMVEAAAIAQKLNGVPVKLLWTREDDMAHDFYRPGGFHYFKAGLDAQGKLTGFRDHYVSYGTAGKFGAAADISDSEFPANAVEHFEIAASIIESGVPTGPLRAPRSNGHAFVYQGFLDELAHAANKDPIAFRIELLQRAAEKRALTQKLADATPAGQKPPVVPAFDPNRTIAVLQKVKEVSGWGRAVPKGTGLGCAFYWSHRGHFAEVVEASVSDTGAIKVHKVWVAADVGSQIVNPFGALNQVQGAVIDGISVALGQKITIADGATVQRNFHQYPLLRMPAAPDDVEVHWVKSNVPPTGLGEPALPPVAPAMAAAIFSATGKRLRALPFNLNDTPKAAEAATASKPG
jgi:isoquinoline 1-oxidoreductase beta subunit